MTNNRLNGTDWTKQLISRILQITHSQWIYRNISLHDKSNGYLRNKTAEELAEEIHRLAELQPEDVPTESKFLLEIDSGKLIKEHVETQAYWVIAVKAARKAKAAQIIERKTTSKKEDTRQDIKQAESGCNRSRKRDYSRQAK
jgi:ADP-glucose pyrophosphorylase